MPISRKKNFFHILLSGTILAQLSKKFKTFCKLSRQKKTTFLDLKSMIGKIVRQLMDEEIKMTGREDRVRSENVSCIRDGTAPGIRRDNPTVLQ